MTPLDSHLGEMAGLWASRAADPAFDDWDGFTAWLEADPAHLAAYEAALDAGDWAADVLSLEGGATQANGAANDDDSPAWSNRRRGWSSAIAASVALVGALFAWNAYSGPGAIVTQPGEHRTVQLADGSQVVLNGGTKILLDEGDPRQLELAYGEALFEIRHNAADPFVITVGETRLVDAGTVFNVVGKDGALEVEVAEGAVLYRLAGREIRLGAGEGLSRADAASEPVVTKAAPATVGDWQDGLLQYDNAPLDRIARDLGRNLGIEIVATGGAERKRFAGTLVISGTRAEVFERAEALMGVEFQQQGERWRMIPTHDARR
jgi:transmembrane sensor